MTHNSWTMAAWLDEKHGDTGDLWHGPLMIQPYFTHRRREPPAGTRSSMWQCYLPAPAPWEHR